MTTRELIELLANHDLDQRVMLEDSDGLLKDINPRQITVETVWLGERDQNGDKALETILQIGCWS